MKNIVLTGFMGSGKTTLGRSLAEAYSRTFVDIDAYIEREQKKSICEIFSEEGEDSFRAYERNAIRLVSKKSGLIIALGGGAISEHNVRLLKENGIILFLHITPETAYERLKADDSRPLLSGGAKLSKICRILAHRQTQYEKCADLMLDVSSHSKEELLIQALKLLEPYFQI